MALGDIIAQIQTRVASAVVGEAQVEITPSRPTKGSIIGIYVDGAQIPSEAPMDTVGERFEVSLAITTYLAAPEGNSPTVQLLNLHQQAMASLSGGWTPEDAQAYLLRAESISPVEADYESTSQRLAITTRYLLQWAWDGTSP